MNDTNIIALNQVRFRWPGQSEDIIQIDDLQLQQGEHLFVRGASGSGKTTLLNLLAGIHTANTGCIELLRTNLAALPASKRDQFRADHLGVIFQQFNLLPYLNSLENVVLSCTFSQYKTNRVMNTAKTAATKQGSQRALLYDAARRLLIDLNFPAELHSSPVSKLSVGQQQRIAVARALIGGPEIIIADEPTSALDTENRDRFLNLLFDKAEAFNCTLVFVSHDPQLAKGFQRSIELSNNNRHLRI